jgi:hypothetical protein
MGVVTKNSIKNYELPKWAVIEATAKKFYNSLEKPNFLPQKDIIAKTGAKCVISSLYEKF